MSKNLSICTNILNEKLTFGTKSYKAKVAFIHSSSTFSITNSLSKIILKNCLP